eukprot:TRINITY_DN38245_c0_g1_i1.p1 TRINITY_DN38245_c0_g1~~TRINITY_DN38245_c0_g1_i1.p1  ORF type:complete len:807 (-),score=184.21 TRINITY_DN38245_c0_g1_i1:372-2735(-)
MALSSSLLVRRCRWRRWQPPVQAAAGCRQHMVWHGTPLVDEDRQPPLAAAPTPAASPPALQVPSGRQRDVEAKCAALAEAVATGDLSRFDKVVSQLRHVVSDCGVERREETRRKVPTVNGKMVMPRQEEEDESNWQAVLRKLEDALAGKRSSASSPSRRNGAAPPTVKAADSQTDFEAGLHDYLDSFDGDQAPGGPSTSSETSKEEARWARVMRLLDEAGLDGPSSETRSDEHAAEDVRMSRYQHLLGDAAAALDPQKSVRMGRYAEMLREADLASKIAPGGSMPAIRFGDLSRQRGSVQHTNGAASSAAAGRPKATRELPKPPPVEAMPATPSSSSTAPAASPPPLKPPRDVPKPPRDLGRAAEKRNNPFDEAVGKGNLVSALPGPGDAEVREDAELRKEDFVWSAHDFNDGDVENKRVLKGFQKQFKKMAAETPEGLRNPRLLTAALDLALACVKCYELDKADTIYRRALGECRRRGMPWDVKCLQDLATLRCKQHRQADAAELLEELASIAPPHPATFVNLGTVYNQLRQYDKAETWFRQAINLKGGEPERDDLWNLGIVEKNRKNFKEALPMLEKALAEFQLHEPEHPVTIAKLHSSVAGCLHDMGRTKEAADQYRHAYDIYVATVGKMSPLFCGAAEGLAKALRVEGKYMEALDALLEAFAVHAKGDAVHTTPLFEALDLALEIRDKQPAVDLRNFAPLIDDAMGNLRRRGLASDGNAGLVMIRSGKLLHESGDRSLRPKALDLLNEGVTLIQQSHDAGEADLSYELMQANMLLQSMQREAE